MHDHKEWKTVAVAAKMFGEFWCQDEDDEEEEEDEEKKKKICLFI